METRPLYFTVTGEIQIPVEAELMFAANGEVCGYTVDGKDVRLSLALELNEGERYLTTDQEMVDEAGSQVMEYYRTEFEMSQHENKED